MGTKSDVAPFPLDGDRRSGRIASEAAFILEQIEKRRDIMLLELHGQLNERGTRVAIGTLWRLFEPCGISLKKTSHACEQDHSDVAAAWHG